MTRARDINPVRLRREEKGMLLIELAEKAEVHAAMLSMTEGGFCPQSDSRARIAEALETTPDQLWPEEYA